MRLEVNTLFRYASADGSLGLCKLWIARGRDGTAVAVLTQMPGDPAKEPLGRSIDSACDSVRVRFAIDPHKTKWIFRMVIPASPSLRDRPREYWVEMDFSVGLEGVLYDAESTPTTRPAVEIMAQVEFPEVQDAEHRTNPNPSTGGSAS